MGDVLWYLTVLASRGGLTLNDIASNVQRGYGDWKKSADPLLTFAAMQPEHLPQQREPTPAFETTLLQLAGEVGLLMTDQQAGRLQDNKSALAGRLVAILRTLAKAANEAGVTLEAAAVKNLHKIFDRWPQERRYPDFLDATAQPEEQLPRDLTVDVFEREVRGNIYVFQRCNGINIGDRLTDNSQKADDYRFHDVFHYTYVAVLGWSPVVRSLFRLKRKSDPKVDDAEDGARATLIPHRIARSFQCAFGG